MQTTCLVARCRGAVLARLLVAAIVRAADDAPEAQSFSQLEEMVAPIALYRSSGNASPGCGTP